MRIHKLLKLFPAVSGKRLAELAADIKNRGLLHPIVTHKGVVIDGRARLAACKQARVKAKTVEFKTLKAKCSPEEYIWSTNIERRQLTPDQRATLVFQWKDAIAADAKLRQVAGLKRGDVKGVPVKSDSTKRGPQTTRRELAERAGVSQHKMQQLEVVKKHAPKLVRSIASGKTKLKDAAKIAQARMPKSAKVIKFRNPLTVSKAVKRTLDAFVAEAKIVMLRVPDQAAFFKQASEMVERYCKKMVRTAKAA